jgi:integrase
MGKPRDGVYEKVKGSGVWWISFYDAEGKRRREKVGRRSVALEAQVQRRIEVREGKFRPARQADGLSFGDLMDQAISAKIGRNTSDSIRHDELKREILRPELGALPADKVGAPAIDKALANLQKSRHIEGPTLNRYRAFLSSVFTYAVKRDLLLVNPISKKVERFRENPAVVRFLTDEEEAALRGVLREHFPSREADLDLALHTGLRRGALYSLEWKDVDLANRVVSAHRKTKTGEDARYYVRLNTTAIEALEKISRRPDRDFSLVLPDRKRQRSRHERGWFEWSVKKAGISNFRFHDLRHTFASRLVTAGVDLRVVMELMGHATFEMTLKYAHLMPGKTAEAVEKIVAAAPAKPTPTTRKKVVGIRG